MQDSHLPATKRPKHFLVNILVIDDTGNSYTWRNENVRLCMCVCGKLTSCIAVLLPAVGLA